MICGLNLPVADEYIAGAAIIATDISRSDFVTSSFVEPLLDWEKGH